MHLLRPDSQVDDVSHTGGPNNEIAGTDSSTLSECGIGDGDLLQLLVRAMEWSESELAIQNRVRGCGAALDLSESGLGQRAVSALVWAMSNEVL
jgi:hypothetical protein